MLVGGGVGAVAMQGLNAQTKPSIYYIVEVETTDPSDAYANEFAPKAQAIIKAAGGRFVAIGGAGATGAKEITKIEGDPPRRRPYGRDNRTKSALGGPVLNMLCSAKSSTSMPNSAHLLLRGNNVRDDC